MANQTKFIGNDLFKQIDQSDYQITPFKVYKDWTYNGSNYYANGLQISYGIEDLSQFDSENDSINKDGTYKGLIYDFVHGLYYQSASIGSGSSTQTMISRHAGNIDNFEKINLNMNEKCIFIGIPQQLYGERIKPGSFELQYNTASIIDDTFGNIIDRNNSNYQIGNIFYEHGNIVITDTGSYYNSFNTSSFTSISYKSQFTIYEHSVTCRIGKGEFNTTQNPSSFSGSFPRTYGSASIYLYDTEGFDPYITSIGLYNEYNELLAVAKIPKPIKNFKDLDLNIVIKIDA